MSHEHELEIAKKLWAERAHLRAKGAVVTSWSEHPVIREIHIYPQITGTSHINWLEGVGSRYFANKADRVLNLGCGSGNLDRHGLRINIAQHFDSCDLSPGAVEVATKSAVEKGWGDRVSYFVADLNQHCFPPATYDAVFASHSLHHVHELEHLFAQVHLTLKPGGLFVVNEFVGPNQLQWTDRQLEHARAFYRKIPAHYRINLRSGRIKDDVRRQTLAMMNKVDPTEAIRSQDILPLIYQQFDVIDRRDFGGTIVNLVLDGIAGNFTSSPEDRAILEELCATERALIQSGELPSDFTVLVARRRS